jgi:sarcosine oxidase delta subunit
MQNYEFAEGGETKKLRHDEENLGDTQWQHWIYLKRL